MIQNYVEKHRFDFTKYIEQLSNKKFGFPWKKIPNECQPNTS